MKRVEEEKQEEVVRGELEGLVAREVTKKDLVASIRPQIVLVLPTPLRARACEDASVCPQHKVVKAGQCELCDALCVWVCVVACECVRAWVRACVCACVSS